MRGRKPTPTVLKIARGNPGKRKPRKDEPQYPAGFGPCPDRLTGLAAVYWNENAPLLAASKVADRVGAGAFEMLCQAWADWQEAKMQVETLGAVVESPKRGLVKNPWLTVRKQAYEQYARLCLEFGMTPSSKARAATAGEPKTPKPQDPWSEIA